MGRKRKVHQNPCIKDKDVRRCKAGILLNKLTDIKIKICTHQHSWSTHSATRYAQCTRLSVLTIDEYSSSQAGEYELGKHSTQTKDIHYIHAYICTHLYTHISFPMGVIIWLSEQDSMDYLLLAIIKRSV